MTISDEKLSAFLDGELSTEDMDKVREAIALDETLSDKLAALAEVDFLVKKAAESATEAPVPESIMRLLNEEESQSEQVHSSNNVVSLTQRLVNSRTWKMPLSLAASVAIVAVVSFLQLPTATDQEMTQWASIVQALDGKQTGDTFSDSVVKVTPRLTFIDKQSRYCRQADVAYSEQNATIIACKTQSKDWQIEAQQWTNGNNGMVGEYQTASSDKALEQTLDKLIDSAPLNRAEEEKAIANNWYINKQ